MEVNTPEHETESKNRRNKDFCALYRCAARSQPSHRNASRKATNCPAKLKTEH